jgi:hypothetical protein
MIQVNQKSPKRAICAGLDPIRQVRQRGAALLSKRVATRGIHIQSQIDH